MCLTRICLLFQQQATSQATFSKLCCSCDGLREPTILDTLKLLAATCPKVIASGMVSLTDLTDIGSSICARCSTTFERGCSGCVILYNELGLHSSRSALL